MPRDQNRPTPGEPDEPTEAEFEEFVAAALKVDPKGLSGKHRKNGPNVQKVPKQGKDSRTRDTRSGQ